ncbi:Bug family tripartite tricarboxylate transporter substrate binding protein [Humitalea sp. 24SJ18S-53]|uniref:Bug family tripartite tricarboxylate transporter substrate binding protein n=1 Tax=Humitalea sp. 24SJ18S-53 TaxID=3422307 RepID=UPI003D67D8D6
MHRRDALLLPAALLGGTIGRARAQGSRVAPPPSRFIVPYGAGNITDQVARVLAEAMVPRWGGRMVVDNQPGAGGMLGLLNLTRAPADGSTFAMISVAALAISPHLQKPARYDPFTDLSPICGVSVSSSFLCVNAALPVHSLAELVAYARARPESDPIFYYSPGNATVPHLNLENLRRSLDFPMQHVPYRTSAAGNTDLLANRVQVTIDSFSITLPHMQSGALRPLAYNAPNRHPDFPDVPTFAEAAPGVAMLNAWQALFFPRGTAAPVVEAAARDVIATIDTPAFAAKLPIGTQPFVLGPQELAAYMRADSERLGRLVADIGLQQD